MMYFAMGLTKFQCTAFRNERFVLGIMFICFAEFTMLVNMIVNNIANNSQQADIFPGRMSSLVTEWSFVFWVARASHYTVLPSTSKL